MGIAALLLGGSMFVGPGGNHASAQGTKYYFHGASTDQANKTPATTCAPSCTWNTTAPTGTTDVLQTGPPIANVNQAQNPLTEYWVSTAITGTVQGVMHFDWWWSVQNPSDLAFQDQIDMTIWANSPGIGTSPAGGNIIGRATGLTISPFVTATENSNDVAVDSVAPTCTGCAGVANVTNLVIEATQHFVNGGMTNTVHYDSTAAPSNFIFPWVPPSGGTSPPVTIGPQVFANYDSPPGFQNRDALQRPNSGEPSIGSDWQTGNIMTMAGTQVSQVHFTPGIPPVATWADVTPTQLGCSPSVPVPAACNVSEDSILFTDHAFVGSTPNRTWAENFLINSACNANIARTDTDGGTPATANTNWTPVTCTSAEGPDHPSIGAGPYHSPGPPVTAMAPLHIVYYCSQNIDQALGAECTHSENNGLTWDSPTVIFGTGTPCFAIHGHIRVSADGTAYVPELNCTSSGVNRQGMAITINNGGNYSYGIVSDATAKALNTGTDPSVDASTDETVYFGYEDGSGHPKIAVSQDHGSTWATSADVGAPFNITNSKFSEVIAGEGGRAAFAFLGTSCTAAACSVGDQAATFPGVWFLYVAFTYDHGNSWQVVQATPDPVQRGCIWNGGGSNACRNLLDFNDITVDKTGHVYVAYTNGCTDSTNVPAADRMWFTPPMTYDVYNCHTNTNISQANCATSTGGQTFSENAAVYSRSDCTYGRLTSLVRQVCGLGLFSASDPGFFEGPSCPTAPNRIPETAFVGGVVGTGAAVLGVATVIRRRRAKRGHVADPVI